MEKIPGVITNWKWQSSNWLQVENKQGSNWLPSNYSIIQPKLYFCLEINLAASYIYTLISRRLYVIVPVA